MKSKRIIIGLFLVLFSSYLFAQKQVNSNGYYDNIIRIKLTEPSVKSLQKLHNEKSNTLNAIKGESAFVKTNIQALDLLNKQYNVTEYKRVFRYAGKFEEKHRNFGLHKWYEITFSSKAGLNEIVESYKGLAEVEVSNALPVAKLNSEPLKDNEKISGTNDPKFSQQWHYENTGQAGGTPGADISLLEAWEIETGNSNVIVSIEDGGIDYEHVDIAGNMWINSGETPGNGRDDDNNGFVDDYYGYNFVNDQGAIIPHEHGTHVAGTVAAETNNGTGLAGIAGGSGNNDGIRLMSCQVFTAAGGGGFAEAYAYAADNGAVISQNSWGYTAAGSYDQATLDAIDYFIANAGGAREAMNGGIVIFAAGNDGTDKQWYPGYYSPTLAVAATNNKDKKSYYSNFGTWVDIAAPGGETLLGSAGGVISTTPNDSYGSMQGTSMACPHVSGVAALVVSKFYGTITPQELWNKLVDNTDPIDNLNSQYAGKLGSGRLNAYKAVYVENNDNEPPTAPGNLTSSSLTSYSVVLSWTASTDDNGVHHYTIYDRENEIATTTQLTYNVTGLNPSTTYHFNVKAFDEAGNASESSNVETVTTLPEPGEYCGSASTIFTEEWISEVVINGVSHRSNKSDYSDFTSTIFDFSEPGEKNITITPSYSRNAYNEYFVVWIDFNKDGDFEDAGEEVYSQRSNTTINGIILLPEGLEGNTRMRISMRYDSKPVPCGSFEYGEVEDYTVSFSDLDTQKPTAPTNLAGNNITTTTVDLSWDASSDNIGVDHYIIYKDNVQLNTVSGTSFTVTNLTPNTDYSFVVEAVDAAGNISDPSNELNITTEPDFIEYCDSRGNNSSFFWIQYISLGSIANYSNNDGGYGDYTNLTASLAPGSSQTMYLQAGYSSFTYYTVYWTIWIDFNQNGDFESTELMLSGSTATNQLINGSFTIPSNAKLGNTRMRVSMKYGSLAESCETFDYGEVEDYTINITNQASSLATVNNVQNSVELGDIEIEDLKISPNPAKDIVNLEFTNIPESRVNILSSSGSIVKSFNVTENFYRLNVSDLASGVYFVQFSNKIEVKSKKFIKQ